MIGKEAEVSAAKQAPAEQARRLRAAKDPYNVSTIERAFDVLRTFSLRHPELSLVEIAQAAGLHKATAFRLLTALANRNMVIKNPRTGLYRLGFQVIELAEIAKISTGLVSQARPFMRQIRDQLNETVYIAVRTGDNRVNLEQVEGLRDLRRVVGVGRLTPLYIGSTSLVMLASMPDPEIAAYFDRTELVPPFPGAKVDRQTLWREIAAIRTNGFAETHNKRLDEGASVSAPLRGPGDDVIGALTVTIPIGRYTNEVRSAAITAIKEAGLAVSRELGAPSRGP
jgi:DNA-binding IclR family transcriptional regulator